MGVVTAERLREFGTTTFTATTELAPRVGVVAIPSAVCDDHADVGRTYARFAFRKEGRNLTRAAQRLRSLRGEIPQ